MDGNVDIRSFGFKGETLRALIDKEGEPWFVAKDVCGILGTRTDAIRAILDADEVSEVNPNTIGVARNGGHVRAGHLKLVEAKRNGMHKDGTPFAFPPTVRVTRRGLALLHRRLGEITLDKAIEADARA